MSMNTDLVPTYDDLLHSQIVIDNIEKQDSTLNHNHITSIPTITTLMN